ncbi:hypothetical protein [Patiriisocius marinus]|uniref:hypothetical protein n=1 Tax=Patiriisocius marinus TaxID=1397112 RepID=UPI00232ED60F|nr:hypothetical protein [Patiriisocius marinus]
MRKKVNRTYLEKLNTVLDCPCGCRVNLREELISIKTASLPLHLEVYHNYLVGKFFFYESKVSNKLENLELANERFNMIFVSANNRGKELFNPKYYFKTAHTKYELSKVISNSDDSDALRKQAINLCKQGLEKNTKSSSLLWLKLELEK